MDTDANTIRTFLTAGRAVFTLTSHATGVRITFRVQRAQQTGSDPRPTPYFVSWLTGPDNTKDYVYAGLMVTDESTGHLKLRLTAKSKAGDGAPCVRGFRWLLGMVNRGFDLAEKADVDPEGQCARCGRALTVPESVRTGLGPACARRATS